MSVLKRLLVHIPKLWAEPDFFIIGAIKSSTTSLYQYLNFHSQLESSIIKEPCYYSYNYGKGRRWYLSQFPAKNIFQKGKMYFDASPVYLHDPVSAARIYKDYPTAKLIVILRDPIERAISHYNYYSNKDSNFAKNPINKIDTRSIEVAFRQDIAGLEKRTFFKYCRMGLYANQMQEFLKYFLREQILFLDSKELENDCLNILHLTADFIGVENKDEFNNFDSSKEAVGSTESFSKADQKVYRKFNSMNYNIPVSEEMRSDLINFFSQDVKLLQTMSGRQFSWASKYI